MVGFRRGQLATKITCYTVETLCEQMMLGTLKRLQQHSQNKALEIQENVARSCYSFRRIATVEQLQLEYTD